MSKTVRISDDLAERLEARRLQTEGMTLDAVAEALIMAELLSESDAVDDNAGYTDEELRSLIAEGEASGVAMFRSPAEVSAEVRRRVALRRSGAG
jgi:hypothetical protein